MQRHALNAQVRTVLGKKIKKLRQEGILPANVYGKELASVAIQVDLKEFQTVFKEAGETGLVDLKLDGQTRPVLIKNLQLEYPDRLPLHVDFYQVNLKEKVKTMVPIVVVGEAKAVAEKLGTLLQNSNEVEVEALPAELPENFEVNIEHLAAVDDQITVADLKPASGVEILTDPGQVIVKIAEIVEEPEPEPEVAEGAEGEAAEGEAKTEEGTEEKSGESSSKEETKKEDSSANAEQAKKKEN